MFTQSFGKLKHNKDFICGLFTMKFELRNGSLSLCLQQHLFLIGCLQPHPAVLVHRSLKSWVTTVQTPCHCYGQHKLYAVKRTSRPACKTRVVNNLNAVLVAVYNLVKKCFWLPVLDNATFLLLIKPNIKHQTFLLPECSCFVKSIFPYVTLASAFVQSNTRRAFKPDEEKKLGL